MSLQLISRGLKLKDGADMKNVNFERLKKCMLRSRQGGELTIGFLGGSITQGSLATKPENCYAYRVFSWWRQAFPQAELHYVNGGIGGTTSHFGAARAVSDVLMYQPDVVIASTMRRILFFRRRLRALSEGF